jgi:hypothetical protein
MSLRYATIKNAHDDRSFLTQAGLPLIIGLLIAKVRPDLLARLDPVCIWSVPSTFH